MHKISLLIGFTFLLGGCAIQLTPNDSDPVSLQTALAVISRDLHAAAPVTLSDIETPLGKATLKTAIEERQCADRIANPILPIVTGAFSVALQGSISKSRQVGATIAAPLPSGSFQYQVTKGQQQQVTVPITFVAARALANFFLGQNLANLSGLADKDKLVEEQKMLARRDLINSLTAQVVDKFDALKCPTPDVSKPAKPPTIIFPQSVPFT